MESLAYDFVVVAVYWEWTWQQVYGTLVDSIECSLFESKVKEKIRKDGTCPIYARITVNRKRAEIAL